MSHQADGNVTSPAALRRRLPAVPAAAVYGRDGPLAAVRAVAAAAAPAALATTATTTAAAAAANGQPSGRGCGQRRRQPERAVRFGATCRAQCHAKTEPVLELSVHLPRTLGAG